MIDFITARILGFCRCGGVGYFHAPSCRRHRPHVAHAHSRLTASK